MSFDGSCAAGEGPIAESNDKLFRGVLTGSALVGKVESIRHVCNDVARGARDRVRTDAMAQCAVYAACPGRPWLR